MGSPRLIQTELEQLRPTQITAGFAEVARKRKEWSALSKKARQQLLASHVFPAVRGVDGLFFIVDHHHLGLALLEEGVETVGVTTLEDLSYIDPSLFWRVMEQRSWAHPYDHTGKRRGYDKVPRRIKDLVDDPYRSLAGLLREAGGYAKDTSPFAEFMWADYLRPKISPARIRTSLTAAVQEALPLAKSPLARYLPGWTGSMTVPKGVPS